MECRYYFTQPSFSSCTTYCCSLSIHVCTRWHLWSSVILTWKLMFRGTFHSLWIYQANSSQPFNQYVQLLLQISCMRRSIASPVKKWFKYLVSLKKNLTLSAIKKKPTLIGHTTFSSTVCQAANFSGLSDPPWSCVESTDRRFHSKDCNGQSLRSNIIWQRSLSQLYGNCMKQHVLCEGSCSTYWQ